MIKNIEKGNRPFLLIECDNCGTEYQSFYNPSQLKRRKLEGFNQFENYTTEPCPQCGAIMILNVNLSEEELTEEYFEKNNLPENARIERRKLKSFLEEFDQGGSEN